MNVSPRSISPLDSPLAGSPTASDSPTFCSAENGGDEQILFEGYLYKIPPLKKSLLMVKWSKRWFVLKRLAHADVFTVTLGYYKDIYKRGKPRQIDLSKITGIRPSPKIGSSDHIFAIETEARKYILKALDHNIKNVWLAKLCEFCGQEVAYHVTIPRQPTTTFYHEAIIKLNTQDHVTFATPSSNGTLFSIPHSDVRRLGSNYTCGYSIIWFEICQDSRSDQFFFVAVPSGYETAKQIVQELKVAIQAGGRPLILEDSGHLELSYIARSHYGCQEYPMDGRNQIMQAGLYQIPPLSPSPIKSLSSSGRFFSSPLLATPSSDRVWKEPLHLSNSLGETAGTGGLGGVSLEEFGRRKTLSSRGLPPPTSLFRRPTLDKFVRQNSTSSARHTSNSSFDPQTSVSSLDHALLCALSQDTDTCIPTLPQHRHATDGEREEDDGERGEGHLSSSSGSDVFDSAVAALNTSTYLKRNLSLQHSTSSQNLSPCSSTPATFIAEEAPAKSYHFDRAAHRDVLSVPVVPPRSMISLKDGAYLAEMTTAH